MSQEQDERQWAEQSEQEEWELLEEGELFCQRREEAFEKIFGEQK